MITVCEKGKCTGCMACVDICPRKAISVVDDIEYMNAVIDDTLCINCNMCHKVCQKNHPAEFTKAAKMASGLGRRECESNQFLGRFRAGNHAVNAS